MGSLEVSEGKKIKWPNLNACSISNNQDELELIPLSSFFGSKPIDFPTKMKPCNFSLNLPLLVLDPHLKAMGPIYGFQLIGLVYFIGPYNLDPHLKWPLGFYVGEWSMFLNYLWWSNQMTPSFFRNCGHTPLTN